MSRLVEEGVCASVHFKAKLLGNAPLEGAHMHAQMYIDAIESYGAMKMIPVLTDMDVCRRAAFRSALSVGFIGLSTRSALCWLRNQHILVVHS